LNCRGDLPSDVLALSYGLPTRSGHNNTRNRSARRAAPAGPPTNAALGARGRQEPQRYVAAAFACCPTLPYPTLLYSTAASVRPTTAALMGAAARPRPSTRGRGTRCRPGLFLKPLRGSSAPKHPWTVAPIFFRLRVAFFLLPERPCPALPCPGVGIEPLTYPNLPYPTLGRCAAHPPANTHGPLRPLFFDSGLRFSCSQDGPALPCPALGWEANTYPTLACSQPQGPCYPALP